MIASAPARPAVPAGNLEIERVRTFARVFDRYGVDAILGFVLPGLGDVIGSLLGLYIVAIAIRRRVASVVVVRIAAPSVSWRISPSGSDASNNCGDPVR